jgi:hypothetical protein
LDKLIPSPRLLFARVFSWFQETLALNLKQEIPMIQQNENLKATGKVRIVKTNAQGVTTQDFEVPNLVVNSW